MPSIDFSTLDHITSKIIYSPDRKKKPQEDTRTSAPKPKRAGAVGGTDVNHDEIRKSMVKEPLKIYDARPNVGDYDLDTHGFIIANLKTALPQTLEVMKDPKETEIMRTFWPEVEELAKRSCRLRDGRLPKYSFALGTQKFIPQPRLEGSVAIRYQGEDNIAISYARNAHADFSEVVFDSAYKMLTKRGVPEAEARDGLDLVFVNTWKPYGQTVQDNPLALLDWTSVDAENDVHIQRRGLTTKRGSIYGTSVTYNPNHRWMYLPEHRDDEILLFKQADSRAMDKRPYDLAQYGFHTSFLLPNDPGPEHKTRRSISVRLLLGYEKSATSSKL